jgi:hypothetical protein
MKFSKLFGLTSGRTARAFDIAVSGSVALWLSVAAQTATPALGQTRPVGSAYCQSLLLQAQGALLPINGAVTAANQLLAAQLGQALAANNCYVPPEIHLPAPANFSTPKGVPPNDTLRIGSVTVSNFVAPADGNGFAESTVAVIPPNVNSNCPAGKLVFGSAWTVVLTELDGTSSTTQPWPPTLSPAGSGPPNSSVRGLPYPIFDNQIIALPDGSVIHSMEGATADPVTPLPYWWNETVAYPAKYVLSNLSQYPGIFGPGIRGKLFLMRSTDCGVKWQDMPSIDPATLTIPDPYNAGTPTLGLCAHPRLHNVAQNPGPMTLVPPFPVKRPPVTPAYGDSDLGGFDGHSLFVDPSTKTLYASASCTYGTDTPSVGDTNSGDRNVGVALALLPPGSLTSGNWQVIGYYGKQLFWRQAWTSFPGSNSPLHSANGTAPTIALDAATLVMGVTTTAQSYGFAAPGTDVTSPVNLASLAAAPPLAAIGLTCCASEDIPTDLTLNMGGYVSAARSVGTLKNGSGTSENALISVPWPSGLPNASEVNWSPPPPETKGLHMAFQIYRADVVGTGSLVNPSLLTTIASPNANVYQGTFIEGPPNLNVEMYYWLEQLADDSSGNSALADDFQVKYILFVNGLQQTTPQVALAAEWTAIRLELHS